MLIEDLKMLMAKKNISRSELARMLGDSPQNLYLKFKRNSLKDYDLKEIFEKLNIDAEIIYRNKESEEEIYRRKF